MKTIVIGNLKGGTGKTTSAVNLAYSFSLQQKRVLAIDADPQTNLTPFFVKANQNGRTLRDVIKEQERVKRCICHSRYPNIDIVKGNTSLKENDAADRSWIITALDTLGEAYDICIIDTRPAFENIAGAAILVSDLLLTPVCLDKFCRDNLALVEDFLESLPARQRPEWRVFATKVDGNRKSQRSIYKDLLEKHDYPFLETCISRSAVIDNALELYKPVKKHRAKSQVSQDYLDLAKELLKEVQ